MHQGEFVGYITVAKAKLGIWADWLHVVFTAVEHVIETETEPAHRDVDRGGTAQSSAAMPG